MQEQAHPTMVSCKEWRDRPTRRKRKVRFGLLRFGAGIQRQAQHTMVWDRGMGREAHPPPPDGLMQKRSGEYRAILTSP